MPGDEGIKMPTKKRPIIDALKRCIADAIEHGRLFVRTNTCMNCIVFGVAAFASNLSPEWLAEHQWWARWTPPMLAAFSAITIKISQQVAERKP
jgi:hypothetical protein